MTIQRVQISPTCWSHIIGRNIVGCVSTLFWTMSSDVERCGIRFDFVKNVQSNNAGQCWNNMNRPQPNFHRNKRTSCSKIIRFIVITALTTGLTLTLTLTYCITECSFRLPAVFLELNLKIIHCFALF
jgi:hypothetical protein